MRIFFLTILPLLLFLTNSAIAQSNCDLKKDEDGIKVFLCESDSSKFKTIITEFEALATISQYAAMVLDVSNYYQWQYKTTGQKILEKISATEFYYYVQINTPWPVSNRDLIFHLQMTQDPVTKVLSVKLTENPDYLPEEDGVVRVPEGHSLLTVTPIDKKHVRVRYEFFLDPGGMVPAWAINLFAAQAPWETFNNFRNRIIAQGTERITAPFILDY